MQLGPDVYAALVDGDLIFLDAGRDRYSCVTRADAPDVLSALNTAAPSAGETGTTGELRDAGLLVDGCGSGFHPADPHRASVDFHDLGSAELPITPLTVARLAAAAFEAAAKVRARPARWLRPQGEPIEGACSRAATLALQFERLRPCIPKSGRCLPNSLMLLGFLRRHGVRAQLVVGVRSFPFEAHCWVQHKGVVLNDTVEHVGWYVPIAVA
jgi:hypothetical protein